MLSYNECEELYNSARDKEKGKPLYNSRYYLKKNTNYFYIYSIYNNGELIVITPDNNVAFNIDQKELFQIKSMLANKFNIYVTRNQSQYKRLDTHTVFQNQHGNSVMYKPGLIINEYQQFLHIPSYTKFVPDIKANNMYTQKSKAFRNKLEAMIALLPNEIDVDEDAIKPYDEAIASVVTAMINEDNVTFDLAVDALAVGNHYRLKHYTPVTPKTLYNKRYLHDQINHYRDEWLMNNGYIKEIEVKQ